MPIDTSSYPTQVQPPNTLGTLNSAMQFQALMNQNRLFQQQYNTNLAVSNIYKQAINPDGTIDQDKLSNLLKTDPNASYGLPQAYQSSQEAQQRGLNISAQQLDLARQNNQILTGYLGPLASNPNVTPSDVFGAASMAITRGHVNPGILSRYLSDMPQQGGAPLQAWLQQHLFQALTNEQQFSAMNPTPTLVQTGQGQIPLRLPQQGPVTQAGPMIANQPSPTTPYYDEKKQAMAYTGNLPQGGLLPPGTLAQAPFGTTETTGAAAQQGITLNRLADSAMTRKALLGNLEGDLQHFTSGPGADWTKVAQAALNRPIQAFGGTGFNPRSIASQEEFTKQAVQLAQGQFQALGGTGANEQLESAMHTSPNETLSKMGNEGIIQMLKGNEDAILAKRQEWQNWLQSHGPGTYNEFSTQFNKEYDPRVFQSQYMGAQDRAKMLSGMNKNEQTKFRSAYNLAVQNNWIPDPRSQNGQ